MIKHLDDRYGAEIGVVNMTPCEAIQRIQTHNEIHSKREHFAIYITEALYMAVEALEKQISTKPNAEIHVGELYWYCPSCGEWIDEDHIFDDHCSFCGQALDWSEIE
jgi:rubrerythrin